MLDDAISRRAVLKAGGFTGLGIALAMVAGCGNNGSGGGSDSLRVAWWGSQDRHTAVLKTLDAYRKSQPKVKIQTQYSGVDGYFEKLTTQIAGGSAPDVMALNTQYLVEFASRGALTDLAKLPNETNEIAGFAPAVLAPSRIGGQLVGIPVAIGTTGFILNESAFSKAGVALPAADGSWTWDQFADLAKQLTRPGLYGTSDASCNEGAWSVFEVFLRQRGKELYTADGKLAFDESDLGDFWQYWNDLRTKGWAIPATLSAQETNPATSAFVAGKAAIYSNSVSLFGDVQSAVKSPLALALLPQTPGQKSPGQYVQTSKFLSIYGKSGAPSAAGELINYMTTSPDGIKSLGTAFGNPAATAAAGVLQASLDAADKTLTNYLTLATQKGSTAPPFPPPGDGDLSDLFVRSGQSIAFGKASIASAAKSFFDQSKKSVK